MRPLALAPFMCVPRKVRLLTAGGQDASETGGHTSSTGGTDVVAKSSGSFISALMRQAQATQQQASKQASRQASNLFSSLMWQPQANKQQVSKQASNSAGKQSRQCLIWQAQASN